MSDSNDPDRENESLRHFLRIVRAAQPNGPDDDQFWDLVTKDAEDVDVSEETQREARNRARLALALARHELTLGKYLSSLRDTAKLSRDAAAKVARLSPDAVAEIESDKSRLLSVEARRLANLAVAVGAVKAAFMELAAQAIGRPTSQTGLPRLTRIDRDATLLESERAVRRSQTTPSDSQPETYLSELSSAFDDEKERNRKS